MIYPVFGPALHILVPVNMLIPDQTEILIMPIYRSTHLEINKFLANSLYFKLNC